MVREFLITPVKTYKTHANAVTAVEKAFPVGFADNLRYFIMTHVDGRFFPVFVGQAAASNGVHFHFNVIA